MSGSRRQHFRHVLRCDSAYTSPPHRKTTCIAMTTPPFDPLLAEKILQGVRQLHQIRLAAPETRDLAIDEARRTHDWMRFVFLHDPTAWIDAFEQQSAKMDDSNFWQVLRRIYTSLPAAVLHHDRLVQLFASRPAPAVVRFEPEDLCVFDQLPDPIRIHRGYADPYSTGLSWSLSRRTAKFFAYRAAERSDALVSSPQMLSGLAYKKDVITLIGFMNEREVLIDPSRVTKKRRRTLGPLRSALEDLIA